MKKILICVPTYNEADNIIPLLDTVKKYSRGISGYNIGCVVIDDNSPDGTGQLVDEFKAKNTGMEVHVVHNKKKGGLGYAYVCGFKHAIKQGAYAVMEMDADFSHNPAYIPQMIKNLKDYDFVVGSRYVRGGGTPGWSLKRKLISWGGNQYSKFILWRNINDLTGGFNLYKTAIFEKVDLDTIKSTGFSFQIELKFKVLQRGFKGKEIPIIFKDREKGESKFDGGIFKEALLVPWKLRLGRM